MKKKWNKIERDSIGNASDSCMNEIFANLPVEIYTEDNSLVLIDSEESRLDVKMSTCYTYWRKIDLPGQETQSDEPRWHLCRDVLPKPMSDCGSPCSKGVVIELEDGFNDIAYFDHEERGWFKDYDEPITEAVIAWFDVPKRNVYRNVWPSVNGLIEKYTVVDELFKDVDDRLEKLNQQ